MASRSSRTFPSITDSLDTRCSPAPAAPLPPRSLLLSTGSATSRHRFRSALRCDHSSFKWQGIDNGWRRRIRQLGRCTVVRSGHSDLYSDGLHAAPPGRADLNLLADGRVLITGGRGGTAISSPATATAEIYDPIAGTFALTASPMNFPRRLHTATALADGTVLIVGGVGANLLSTQNTAEIFDPKNGSFTLVTATLVTARFLHTATLLPDGTVLLAGGQFAGATLSSAEIYNPSVPSFTAVPASMNSPRSLFNAVLLPTGKALLVGGFSDSTGTIATATAELYDPSNASFTPTGSMSTARSVLHCQSTSERTGLGFRGLSAITASSTFLGTAEVYDPITWDILADWLSERVPCTTDFGDAQRWHGSRHAGRKYR